MDKLALLATIAVIGGIGGLAASAGAFRGDAPTAYQARLQQEKFNEICFNADPAKRNSEYCRTHKLDGSPRSPEELAEAAQRRKQMQETVSPVTSRTTSAADRADFEALLKDASR